MSIPTPSPAAAPVRAPRISVVIPVKDHLAELRRVLTDLAVQSRLPDEIVVVDNGPDDRVVDLAEAAGARVVREAEPGVAAAAAAGYDAATGDVIARCDADSRLPRHWVAEIDRALADPSVAAVAGPGYFYDVPPRLAAFRVPLSELYMGLYRWSITGALADAPVFGSSFAIRSGAWATIRQHVHRTGTDIHDDIDISLHLGDHDLRIAWTPRLAVGISADPLRHGVRRRLSRGWRALAMHWPAGHPVLRWRRRAKRSLGRLRRT